jgi:hypothetical protein
VPYSTASGRQGDVFVWSRAGLSSSGPIYVVSVGGEVTEVLEAASDAVPIGPYDLAVDSSGDLIICGAKSPGAGYLPRVAKLRLDGSIVWQVDVPLPEVPPFAADAASIAVDRDGSLWVLVRCFFCFTPGWVFHLDGATGDTLSWFALSNGVGLGIEVDPQGRLYVQESIGSFGGIEQFWQNGVVLGQFYYPAQPTHNFTLSANGDELWTVVGSASQPYRLFKVSLSTGQVSSPPLETSLAWLKLPSGDSMGYDLASIVDPGGDADGDGFPNRVEVDAGSVPYDVGSTPSGPRTYVTFQPGVPIALTFIDSDGVLGPAGLDLSSVSLTIDDGPNIFCLFITN